MNRTPWASKPASRLERRLQRFLRDTGKLLETLDPSAIMAKVLM
jgi:hypothetical protein